MKARFGLFLIALGLPLGWAEPGLSQRPAPEIQYPAYSGPRRTIAVSKFDAVGSFVAEHGGWDIGGGLAAMLASELTRTSRFIVLERADLDTLLREQQMALSDVTQGGSGRPLLGAQTFIRGSVTEFDQKQSGGGMSLGVGTGNLTSALARKQSKGHVAIQLRLIDAATGTVLSSHRVEKEVKSSSHALQGKAGLVSIGGDQFQQTSLGQATREAIAQAVAEIIRAMEAVPWQGLVANVDGATVHINAGRQANLKSGMTLRAVRREKAITDPATGEILGSNQRTIGDLVIEQVEDRYSVARWLGHEEPRRGDVVQLIGG